MRALGLLLLFVTFACSKSNDPLIQTDTVFDQVVLIVDKCPNYSTTLNDSTGVWSSKDDGFEITAINSDLTRLSYSTKPVPTRDTVIFPTKGEMLEIEHIYKFYDYLSFLVKKGDTVLFTYDAGYPIAQILNREVGFEELNYEKIKRDYLVEFNAELDGGSQFEVLPHSAYKGYLAIRDKIKRGDLLMKLKKKAINQAEIDLEKENELLDSLYSKQLISQKTRDFFSQKSQTEYDYHQVRFKLLEANLFRQNESKSVIIQYDPLIRDGLTTFGYYYRVLSFLEQEVYFKEVPWIEEVNRRYPDYRLVYDKIKSSNLGQADKNLLLAKNMNLIIQHFTQTDIDSYLEQFVLDVDNDDLVNGIISNNGFSISTQMMADLGLDSMLNATLSLSLIDVNNRQIAFQDLLKSHRGKLVYVDVWASFCVPCFVAMPYSKDLINDYEGREVAFVYISMDKEFKRWEQGFNKAGIEQYEMSYMVDWTDENNQLISRLNVNEIPRYLLFNQDGDLIQYKAFGPKTLEIREVFERYLD